MTLNEPLLTDAALLVDALRSIPPQRRVAALAVACRLWIDGQLPEPDLNPEADVEAKQESASVSVSDQESDA